MIKPIVAGQFYEAGFDKLNKQIDWCFKSPMGPGDFPTKRSSKRLFGVIAPHAGYQFSGPCQAWSYKEIAESRFSPVFVIVAPDHSGIHNGVVTSKGDWETPFGIVRANAGLVNGLMKKCDFVSEAKICEHAIEVQLPFLQYVSKDRLKDISFVPLVVSSGVDYAKLGEAIADMGDDVCVIASSDMTHFGPAYGYVPFTEDIKERIYAQDSKALSFVKKLDAAGFLDFKRSTGATICGAYAVAVAIEAVKNMFAKRGELLMYYTSGDVEGSYNNAVGYAAVAFK